jgi:serine/threonine protein kinase
MLQKGYILDKKYEVIKILGKGGMGTVYLCKNINLENMWAIKEIKKDNGVNTDILTEPNILKELNYPGIPRIVDIFYKDDYLYMVEDYIEGQTLKEYVHKKEKLGTEEICSITLKICNIIGYLHNMNPSIIYRDLKPSNIMITHSENIVLIDFGISKIDKTNKYNDTVALGSIGYAAPEQRGAGKCCKQTDIFGIGMVMYYMVNGKAALEDTEPFNDENYNNVNDNLKSIIQKCVKSNINERYESISELEYEIAKCQNNLDVEKTIVINEAFIKQKAKKNSNGLIRNILVFMVLMAIVLTMLYHFYGNVPKYNDNTTVDAPKTDNTINSLPQGEDAQQPDQQPSKDNVTNNDSSITKDNNATNPVNTTESYLKQHKGKKKK